jgi:signal transduction histidine kinase
MVHRLEYDGTAMESSESNEPAGPRTVGILLFDEVEVLDFCGPYEVFVSARPEWRTDDDTLLFDVVTIAEEKRPVHCIGGLLVQPQFTFESSADPIVITDRSGHRGTPFEYHGMPHVLSMIRDSTARVEAEEAVKRERQRLSRELHDSVSQALYSITLGARTARTMADTNPAGLATPLNFVIEQAERVLAEMRALIFELRPEPLEQEGLVAAMAKRAAALEAQHQLRLELTLCDEPAVPLPVKEALYRITQEAMQNTVKHAQATDIRLILACSDEMIVLEIHDNGKGFDPTRSFPGHLGLQSMSERASQLGGVLEMKSAEDAGTSIQVRVPLGTGMAVAPAVPI